MKCEHNGDSEDGRTRHQNQTFDRTSHGSSGAFPLIILFTTESETLTALVETAHLANQLGADIQILIPYLVPYPLPLDKPRVQPEFKLRNFIWACHQQTTCIRIDILLCRDLQGCIDDGLRPKSVVIVGGRERWWPLSPRMRLMRRMRKAGHQFLSIRTHNSRYQRLKRFVLQVVRTGTAENPVTGVDSRPYS